MSKCKCKSGGRGTCSSGDIAICREIDGRCHTSCETPRDDMTTEEFVNWAFALITNNTEPRARFSYKRRILKRGTYVIRQIGGPNITINFELPNRPF